MKKESKPDASYTVQNCTFESNSAPNKHTAKAIVALAAAVQENAKAITALASALEGNPASIGAAINIGGTQ